MTFRFKRKQSFESSLRVTLWFTLDIRALCVIGVLHTRAPSPSSSVTDVLSKHLKKTSTHTHAQAQASAKKSSVLNAAVVSVVECQGSSEQKIPRPPSLPSAW